MKNLLTLLLLVISLLSFGQSDSQSLEVEIQYWKSIAESNDTVAYREYLQRYGEDGLYKDEARTRIALLKTSGKQVQSKSIECCFYKYGTDYSVVRFDSTNAKLWFKHTYYDTIRSNLAVSRDFYENQATIALSRGTWEYRNAIENDKKAIEEAEYAREYLINSRKRSERQKGEEMLKEAEQAKSPDYYKNAWTADEENEYVPMKSTSAREVYCKQNKLFLFERAYSCVGRSETPYPSIYVYHDDNFFVFDIYDRYTKNYEHGTFFYSAKEDERGRRPYFVFTNKEIMQGYRYIAISKDKSSIIMWFEEDDNLDGVILEKREYKRVPKEELLPKKVNYDFLNR